METEKSFSGEEAEKDFCGRLFFLAAIFPFSNEKACLGVTAKTDFFYRLRSLHLCRLLCFLITQLPSQFGNGVGHDADNFLCLVGSVISPKTQS